MTIKVIVNGVRGRMGQETAQAINKDSTFKLVAGTDREDNLEKTIKEKKPDIVIDFTSPDSVYINTKTIIDALVHPVIGTTGLTSQQIQELKELSATKQLGGLIAPNFSIGAVLMMRFAKEAAKYLPQVEIIEMHHDGKKDAPSGTAIKTAEMIAAARKSAAIVSFNENLKGARGAAVDNIAIHSVRLPGLMAHQQVIFGEKGETLCIKHNSIHRECFMPGVIFACKKVMELDRLVYGLDEII